MTDLNSILAQRKLNAAGMSIETPRVFLDKFPDLKREKADRLFRRYLDTVGGVLLPKLPFLQGGETYASTHGLLNDCGEFRYKGTRHWTFNEFKDIYPLFTVASTGSNIRHTNNPFEKNSRIKVVNERLLVMLLEEKSPKSVYEHFYTSEDEDAADSVVPIDMENLERFIGNTKIELEKVTATEHRAKLQRNVWQAKLVYKIGLHTEAVFGRPVMPHVPVESPFGRTYYKGMNIQNVSKQVRSATIGRHYQYDMNAAVFAIKLSIYGYILGGDNNIQGTPLGSYTRDYLENKKLVRERLAKSCFHDVILSKDASVNAIKSALTAIGFGAKRGGSTWMQDGKMQGTALSEILMNKGARDRFEADPWVQAFLAEQTVIENVILDAYLADPVAERMNEAVASSNSANGRVTRGGQMAWIYQQEEKRLMDLAVDALAEKGIAPIARIHDAFIVSDKLSPTVLDDIAYKWGLRDYLSLDCEEVREWIAPAFKRALIDADADLVRHRELMQREEEKAQKKAALKRVVR
jgi:hypothetical protein